MRLRRTHPFEMQARAAVLAWVALFAAAAADGEPEPRMKLLARSAAPVVLGSGAVAATLVPAGGPLAAQLGVLPRGHGLYLVVRGLTTESPPGTLYTLFLDLPDGVHPGRDDPWEIGAIGFYNARRPGATNAPDAESPVNTDAEKTFFSFDVTTQVRTLHSRGLLREPTTITLVPDRPPNPSAKPKVAHLELVEQ